MSFYQIHPSTPFFPTPLILPWPPFPPNFKCSLKRNRAHLVPAVCTWVQVHPLDHRQPMGAVSKENNLPKQSSVANSSSAARGGSSWALSPSVMGFGPALSFAGLIHAVIGAEFTGATAFLFRKKKTTLNSQPLPVSLTIFPPHSSMVTPESWEEWVWYFKTDFKTLRLTGPYED